MKKILIVNNNLHIGGVQKALISLIWNVRNRYDVTLLLFYLDGEYRKDLPTDVKVITPESGYRYLGMARQDAVKWQDKLGRAFYAGITCLFGRKYAVALMAMGQKQLGEYDIAISYLHNSSDKAFYGGCNDFVLKHVSAKKKITFLHCDYMLCGANTSENAKQYAQFDTIAACSRGCADAFLQANPLLEEKVVVIPNCHRYECIRADADAAPVCFAADKTNIVTVARLGKEKGVERALRVVANLGPHKDKMHYYIVGDGIQRAELLSIIEKEDLGSYVTLCGMKENPYGYIRAADLLLIPSYSEAAPMVINEAAVLGTPILSTETSSAREMIEGAGYGWVCENNEEAMKAALQHILEVPLMLSEKRKDLQLQEFNNTKAMEQFGISLKIKML